MHCNCGIGSTRVCQISPLYTAKRIQWNTLKRSNDRKWETKNEFYRHNALPPPETLVTFVEAKEQVCFDIAVLHSSTASIISGILKPVLSISSLLMIVRIVMTWYPEIEVSKLPWSVAYTPTEPLLSVTRKIIKPFNGLDVSPIVWVALLSFMNEILTGPQGILTLIERKGI